MMLAIAGVALLALTVFAVWSVAERAWHVAAIGALAAPLLPLFARTVTGDVSAHLPPWMFSDAASGKDDVAIASVSATLLLAVLLAACVFGGAKAVWRRRR